MPNSKDSSPRRQPGRPPAEEGPQAREALLDAASRLFAARGVEGVSLRRIADQAGVTPAMVHYYFGSKEGLHDALLARTFTGVLERLRSESRAGGGLKQLLDVLFATIAAEPWIPTLVVREVLTEGGRFREEFIREYATHVAALFPSLIRKGIDADDFRDDLDPTLAFLSLMGMSIMPFVARPIAERVLGVEYDAEFIQRLAKHTHRLFLEGAKS